MADIEQQTGSNAIQVEEKGLAKGPYPHGTDSADKREESLLVAFDPDDPESPLNWSTKVKWGVTMAMSATGFNRIMVSTVCLNNMFSGQFIPVLTLIDHGACNRHHCS